MFWYVIIAFVAILIGMCISVYAFGTGAKRSRIFKEIYFSVEDIDGKAVIYTKTGEYSAILKFENPVRKFSADIDSYYDYSNLFTSIFATLGEGYAIHKQDVFIRRKFKDEYYQWIFNTFLVCNSFWILIIRAPYSNRFAQISWFIMPIVLIYPFMRKRFWINHERMVGLAIVIFYAFGFITNMLPLLTK